MFFNFSFFYYFVINSSFAKYFYQCQFNELVLYFGQATGYYEYKNNQKTTLTEESIKRFEQDIKDGKDINVSNYKAIHKYNILLSCSGFPNPKPPCA